MKGLSLWLDNIIFPFLLSNNFNKSFNEYLLKSINPETLDFVSNSLFNSSNDLYLIPFISELVKV